MAPVTHSRTRPARNVTQMEVTLVVVGPAMGFVGTLLIIALALAVLITDLLNAGGKQVVIISY